MSDGIVWFFKTGMVGSDEPAIFAGHCIRAVCAIDETTSLLYLEGFDSPFEILMSVEEVGEMIKQVAESPMVAS